MQSINTENWEKIKQKKWFKFFKWFNIVLMIFAFIFLCYKLQAQERYELQTNKLLVEQFVKELHIGIGFFDDGKRGKHRAELTDKINRAVGNPLGSPWCAALQYYCFLEAQNHLFKNFAVKYSIPISRTGNAQGIFNDAKQRGIKTDYTNFKIGDLLVWKLGNTNSGHIEAIVETGRNGNVVCVGGNTSSGVQGNQRNGAGWFLKKRNIYHPLGRLQVKGIVGFDIS